MRENAREFALWFVGGAVGYTLKSSGLIVAVGAGIVTGLVAWWATDKVFSLVEGTNVQS